MEGQDHTTITNADTHATVKKHNRRLHNLYRKINGLAKDPLFTACPPVSRGRKCDASTHAGRAPGSRHPASSHKKLSINPSRPQSVRSLLSGSLVLSCLVGFLSDHCMQFNPSRAICSPQCAILPQFSPLHYPYSQQPSLASITSPHLLCFPFGRSGHQVHVKALTQLAPTGLMVLQDGGSTPCVTAYPVLDFLIAHAGLEPVVSACRVHG